MGMVIVYAALMILLNLVADLVYAWPRSAHSPGAAIVKSSLWRDAIGRLRGDRLAMTSLCVLVWPGDCGARRAALHRLSRGRNRLVAHRQRLPFEAAGHWLGTDRLGRDLLLRTLLGLRVSLAIAVAATLVSLVIGVAWGALAGYLRGRTDALMMRFVDVLYALPQVFFVIILTVVFGRGPLVLLVAIGAFGWLTMARIVRGQALALREREFCRGGGRRRSGDAAHRRASYRPEPARPGDRVRDARPFRR